MQPGDVTFPLSPDGLNNRVRVQVFRTAARQQPGADADGQFFGVTQVNIGAVATAEASPANAMTCVKPFTIPDEWVEKHDSAVGPGRHLRHVRQPQQPAAERRPCYIPAGQPGYTGYNQESDAGH